MITIKIADKDYQVRTSWKDVTYSNFCDIISFEDEKDTYGFISVVSGIECNTLKNIDDESLLTIKNLISFVEDYSFLEKFNFVDADLSKFNIGNHSWYKLEKAKREITKHKKVHCAMGAIIKIYLGEVINDKPIHKAWGKINFFLKNINDFYEKYKRLSDYEHEDDEILARVNRFERFGFFASCVELARKMGKSYDEVLNMKATEIYETFLYDFERADYEKTLYRIKSNKQK